MSYDKTVSLAFFIGEAQVLLPLTVSPVIYFCKIEKRI